MTPAEKWFEWYCIGLAVSIGIFYAANPEGSEVRGHPLFWLMALIYGLLWPFYFTFSLVTAIQGLIQRGRQKS